jgi:hypothetical protein
MLRTVDATADWKCSLALHAYASCTSCRFILPLHSVLVPWSKDRFCKLNGIGALAATPLRAMDMLQMAQHRVTRLAWLRCALMSCRALESLHMAGVFHNDVALDSLLASGVELDARGRVVSLSNVELCSMSRSVLVGACGIVPSGTRLWGSPHCVPPEWLSPDGTTKRLADEESRQAFAADVYMLGCALATLAAGKGHAMANTAEYRDTYRGNLSALASHHSWPHAVGADVLQVLQGMLELAPQRRVSASEAARRLEALLIVPQAERAGMRCECGRHGWNYE